MNRAILSAFVAFWRRNPLQLCTLIAGLALATALWSGVQAINAEAKASYRAAASMLGEADLARLVPDDGQPIPIADYVALRRAGWLVSPVVEGRINDVRVIGIEPLTAPTGMVFDATETPDPAALKSGPDTVIAGVTLVPDPALPPQTAIGDIGTVSGLLGTEGITRLVLAPQQRDGLTPIATIVPGLTLRAAQSGSDISGLTESFHLNLTAFGLLSFAVGIFIVHGAIGLAFEQRRAMIRTLRALGVPLGRLVMLMGVELVTISLVGGMIGIVLGYLVAAALLPDVAATLDGLYGANVAGTVSIRAEWWLSGLMIAVLGGAIASASVLFRLARMPVLANAQPRAWAVTASRLRRATGLTGALLILIAIILSWQAQGLIAGFGALGALLLGAAFLLPVVLSTLVARAKHWSRGALVQWFWADTLQQLPGLSLALAALLLAMATNVGVSTMVSSFRLTFVGFLDHRLASELYVTVPDRQTALTFEAWIAPQVDAVLPIDKVDVEINGFPTELYGPVNHSTYAENWVFLDAAEDPWSKINAGDAIAINEQLAYRTGLDVGDTVVFGGHSFVVGGIYGDYGNPVGQAVVGRGVFKTMFPDSQPLRFGLRVAPEQVPALRDAIRTAFADPNMETIDQAALKAVSMGIFDRTFTVTAALNVLTLGVAGFAILTSMLTLAGMRLPGLAPVWAMGLTRRQIALTEVARAVMLSVGTTVLAIPVGLVLAWVLLTVVNVAAFGWKLPMYLFPMDYGVLAVQAVCAALIASVWPAWRLARIPPSGLLGIFANER